MGPLHSSTFQSSPHSPIDSFPAFLRHMTFMLVIIIQKLLPYLSPNSIPTPTILPSPPTNPPRPLHLRRRWRRRQNRLLPTLHPHGQRPRHRRRRPNLHLRHQHHPPKIHRLPNHRRHRRRPLHPSPHRRRPSYLLPRRCQYRNGDGDVFPIRWLSYRFSVWSESP